MTRFHRLLRAKCRFLNFALNHARLDRRQRAARCLDALQQRPGADLDFVGARFDFVGAGHGIDRVGDAGFERDDLLRAQRQRRRFLGGQRQGLVSSIAVERLRAAEHRRERLHGDAHQVVVGLLRGERAAGGLRVKSQLLRARVRHAEPLAHDARPQAASRAELGDLFEKIVVRGEEKRQTLRRRLERQSARRRSVDVGDAVGERERDFLNRRRSRFANVVSTYRDRVPPRQLVTAESTHVGDEAQRCLWRIDVGSARGVFLQNIVLHRTAENFSRDLPPIRERDVHRQQDDGGGVDCHRCGNAIQRNAFEQLFHVVERIDGHPHAAHFASGQRMIRVVAHLGRQVERNAESGHSL